MLLAAFFSALAVTFTKFSYRYVPPLLFAFYIMAALSLAISAALAFRRSSSYGAASPAVLGLGTTYALGMALHYVGLSFLIAVYFISIKRLSIVFDVIFGRLRHREEHFGPRLAGALLMVAGVILIAFG